MLQIETQLAYILHSRPYRETSLLLEIFTKDYGRLGVIAKGVRTPKAKARGLLQPFVPLLVSCGGKGELLLLKTFEAADSVFNLKGRRLFCGFYLNELLMRLLHKEDPHVEVFLSYQETLMHLGKDATEQRALRLFEKALLKSLGYELPLIKEVETGQCVLEEQLYLFDPERGPLKIEGRQQDYRPHQQNQKANGVGVFKGKSLLALDQEQLEDPQILGDAKRLLRQALALYLGTRPLESRKLLS
jgi:DNA repair protein RecO (recombination protein O)